MTDSDKQTQIPGQPGSKLEEAAATSPSGDTHAVPASIVAPEGAGPWVWALPLLALLFAGFLVSQSLGDAGPTLVIHTAEGHGVKVGDTLRYRGIVVGEVRRVELGELLEQVVIELELEPGAEKLARVGSRFWIVRPNLSLDGISGLDTIVGARYISVLPGPPAGEFQGEFVALAEAPLVDVLEEGGLEVRLQAKSQKGLRAGAPITYRKIQVGSILSVALASDATRVNCRAYIFAAYSELVRSNTVFWRVTGIDFEANLVGGVRVELESLRTLLVGGVSLATPDQPGEHVSTGHRFKLHSRPEEEWLDWKPPLPIGSALLPRGAPIPSPSRATLRWRTGRLFKSDRMRQGWVMALSDGLVGPANLLAPSELKDEEQVVLEVGGQSLQVEIPRPEEKGHLVCIDRTLPDQPGWPRERVRVMKNPEACLLISDAGRPPLAIAASRLRGEDGEWVVSPALPLGESWHGAAVIAREDGFLIGLLQVRENVARISAIPR